MRYVVVFHEALERFEIQASDGTLVDWMYVDESNKERMEVKITRICNVLNDETERVSNLWRQRLREINDELQPIRTHLANAIQKAH